MGASVIVLSVLLICSQLAASLPFNGEATGYYEANANSEQSPAAINRQLQYNVPYTRYGNLAPNLGQLNIQETRGAYEGQNNFPLLLQQRLLLLRRQQEQARLQQAYANQANLNVINANQYPQLGQSQPAIIPETPQPIPAYEAIPAQPQNAFITQQHFVTPGINSQKTFSNSLPQEHINKKQIQRRVLVHPNGEIEIINDADINVEKPPRNVITDNKMNSLLSNQMKELINKLKLYQPLQDIKSRSESVQNSLAQKDTAHGTQTVSETQGAPVQESSPVPVEPFQNFNVINEPLQPQPVVNEPLTYPSFNQGYGQSIQEVPAEPPVQTTVVSSSFTSVANENQTPNVLPPETTYVNQPYENTGVQQSPILQNYNLGLQNRPLGALNQGYRLQSGYQGTQPPSQFTPQPIEQVPVSSQQAFPNLYPNPIEPVITNESTQETQINVEPASETPLSFNYGGSINSPPLMPVLEKGPQSQQPNYFGQSISPPIAPFNQFSQQNIGIPNVPVQPLPADQLSVNQSPIGPQNNIFGQPQPGFSGVQPLISDPLPFEQPPPLSSTNPSPVNRFGFATFPAQPPISQNPFLSASPGLTNQPPLPALDQTPPSPAAVPLNNIDNVYSQPSTFTSQPYIPSSQVQPPIQQGVTPSPFNQKLNVFNQPTANQLVGHNYGDSFFSQPLPQNPSAQPFSEMGTPVGPLNSTPIPSNLLSPQQSALNQEHTPGIFNKPLVGQLGGPPNYLDNYFGQALGPPTQPSNESGLGVTPFNQAPIPPNQLGPQNSLRPPQQPLTETFGQPLISPNQPSSLNPLFQTSAFGLHPPNQLIPQNLPTPQQPSIDQGPNLGTINKSPLFGPSNGLDSYFSRVPFSPVQQTPQNPEVEPTTEQAPLPINQYPNNADNFVPPIQPGHSPLPQQPASVNQGPASAPGPVKPLIEQSSFSYNYTYPGQFGPESALPLGPSNPETSSTVVQPLLAEFVPITSSNQTSVPPTKSQGPSNPLVPGNPFNFFNFPFGAQRLPGNLTSPDKQVPQVGQTPPVDQSPVSSRGPSQPGHSPSIIKKPPFENPTVDQPSSTKSPVISPDAPAKHKPNTNGIPNYGDINYDQGYIPTQPIPGNGTLESQHTIDKAPTQSQGQIQPGHSPSIIKRPPFGQPSVNGSSTESPTNPSGVPAQQSKPDINTHGIPNYGDIYYDQAYIPNLPMPENGPQQPQKSTPADQDPAPNQDPKPPPSDQSLFYNSHNYDSLNSSNQYDETKLYTTTPAPDGEQDQPESEESLSEDECDDDNTEDFVNSSGNQLGQGEGQDTAVDVWKPNRSGGGGSNGPLWFNVDEDFWKKLFITNGTDGIVYFFDVSSHPILQRDVTKTIYPNGTVVEETVETSYQNDEDYRPEVIKNKTIYLT